MVAWGSTKAGQKCSQAEHRSARGTALPSVPCTQSVQHQAAGGMHTLSATADTSLMMRLAIS